MAIDLADYQLQASTAVRAFWRRRAAARRKQLASGKPDQGERAGVTAGNNMSGFLNLVRGVIRANGLTHADICLERRLLTLPGYFRPTKLWDILVVNRGRLVAAIELKSHVGPSFGNNFNNRAEEAMGTGVDIWTAYREGAFGDSSQPFVGWLMMVEDCPGSRSKVRDASPHFALFPGFCDTSYAERYDMLCRKLMQEQLYTAACVLLSPRAAGKTGAYAELSESTGLRSFVAALAGHVAAEAALAL